MTLHNPWGIKLSAKDISQGWRFCYVEELLAARPMDAKYRAKHERAWNNTTHPGLAVNPETLPQRTYITRTSIPAILCAPPWAKPAPSEPDELDVITKFLGGD